MFENEFTQIRSFGHDRRVDVGMKGKRFSGTQFHIDFVPVIRRHIVHVGPTLEEAFAFFGRQPPRHPPNWNVDDVGKRDVAFFVGLAMKQ